MKWPVAGCCIRLGRTIYDKIVSYVRYQMATLFSLVLLFLVSSILDINNGTPITPLMVLFLSFFITFFPVIVITLDPSPAGLMSQPPRDTKVPLANARSIGQWLLYGVAIFGVALAAMLLSPGTPSQTEPSVPVTMTFVVLSLGSVLAGFAMRRDPGSGLAAPISNALKWMWIPIVLTVLSVELDFMNALLMTTPLDAAQWWLAIGLALIPPIVVEVDKLIRRSLASRAAA